MSRREADRNLLFGINALQNDFITRDSLIAAMNAWALEKHRPIGEILVERGALDPGDREVLEAMIARRLARQGDDPAASLAAISSVADLAAGLRESIADPEVLDSLTVVSGADPYRTREPSSETSTRPEVRYRKVRDHARGGLGVVFVARDAELNREVALKEIQDKHADNPSSRARFLIEAEITGGLEHPGIVPVYGLGSYDDGRPFYAMRFIRGDSLKQAIAAFHASPSLNADPGARAIELQKLLRRFLDVCDAICYAHSRGILHRDLKPDNVMVGKYGETLVVDWGLAKAIGRAEETAEAALIPSSASGSAETIPGSAIGTPAYMSPEQAEGRLDLLGPASDVYSLGATLYALLTGVPPFAGREALEIMARVARGEFRRPREVLSGIERALEAICVKAMALRIEDRYASPRELAEDVARWLAGEPVSAWPEPWLVKARRMASRHRVAVASALAAGVVATIALGAYLATERARGLALVEALKSSEIVKAPAIVEQLRGHRWWTSRKLRDDLGMALPNSPERLRLALAMLESDPGQAGFLLDRALGADAATVGVIREALRPAHGTASADRLWKLTAGPGPDEIRFHAMALLAAFAPDDSRWAGLGNDVARLLPDRYHADPVSFWAWSELLAPVIPGVVPRLISRYDDPSKGADREVIARLVAIHSSELPELVAMAQAADEADFPRFVVRLGMDPMHAIPLLRAAIAEPPPEGDDAAVETWARRRAQAGVALVRVGAGEAAWPILGRGAEPTRRSWMVDRLGPLGVGLGEMADRLAVEADPAARRALVLAMGGTGSAGADRAAVARTLGIAYRDDPDPGMHSAIGWLLRTWGLGDDVKRADAELAGRPRGDRGWFVNPGGQTFVVVRGPAEFAGGTRKLSRSFAICATEVTVAQFEAFWKEFSDRISLNGEPLYLAEYSPEPDCPINASNWFLAAMYCRWLSEREKMSPDMMCYPEVTQLALAMNEPEMPMTAGHLSRTGYRLPTAAEWDYACAAGAPTPRSFGRGLGLLGRYAWFGGNSGNRTWPVGSLKPNDFGLFDMLGNLRELGDDRTPREGQSVDEPATAAPDSAVAKDFPRRRYGGCYRDGANDMLSTLPDAWLPAARTLVSGLRVVRTLDPAP